MKIASVILALLLWTGAAAAQSVEAVQRILDNPKFKSAQEFIDRDHDRIVREIIQLNEIEAPPFKEERRARAFMTMLREHGLTNVEMDAEGNVMGIRRGTGGGPIVAIAAHLDTVFPEGTNVKVRRESTRLYAPGIGDNSRSLAVLLAMIRAFNNAGIQTRSDILFIGNVGEEGQGDLRGMKYLFQKGPYKDRIRMFISLDGSGGGDVVTTGALGSKRYRATFTGPGGHSYGAFGLVNPAYALANAMLKIGEMEVPQRPRTTFNVGVVGGGTSVNSIPFEAWMEVDMRSESTVELDKIVQTFTALVHQAADEENKIRSVGQGRVRAVIRLIGDRPSGATSINSPLVQWAGSAIRAFGMTPAFTIGSTDSNIPISMGIPAITIDSGGRGGRAHALDEWIDVEKTSSVRGISVGMAILLGVAGADQL
jgi:acetylornithine deacetylase/succinyl-diaminopimelate desuccinylase-like protein